MTLEMDKLRLEFWKQALGWSVCLLERVGSRRCILEIFLEAHSHDTFCNTFVVPRLGRRVQYQTLGCLSKNRPPRVRLQQPVGVRVPVVLAVGFWANKLAERKRQASRAHEFGKRQSLTAACCQIIAAQGRGLRPCCLATADFPVHCSQHSESPLPSSVSGQASLSFKCKYLVLAVN